MGKKIIKLTESELYNIVKRVLQEQDIQTITDQQTVERLGKELNQIIKSVQEDIFRQFTLEFSEELYEPYVQIGLVTNKGEELILKYEERGDLYVFKYPKSFNLGGVPIQEYLTTIYKNPTYQTLFNNQPVVKEKLDKVTVDCFMFARGGKENQIVDKNGESSGFITFNGAFRSGEGELDMNVPFSIIDLFNSEGGLTFNFDPDENILFWLDFSNATLLLKELYIGDWLPKLKMDKIPEKFVSITLDNSGTEPFILDSTEIHPDSVGKIDKFVKEINDIKTIYGDNVYQKYIEFLKSNPIIVNAYSSINQDPSKKMSGKVQACNGYGDGTRGQYNLCLSQKRAEVIANELNSKLPELGNFKGVGMGETDKFDVGKKWPKFTSDKDTLLNRRFEVILPNFNTTEKVK
jgi:outer membrane protein OmpA-like peptidoglycan-associated protein